jgi:hypothetical protein
MVDEGHELGVYAALPVKFNYAAANPNWSVSVPPDTPFTLVAVEFNYGAQQPQGSSLSFIAWDIVESLGIATDGTSFDFDAEWIDLPGHAVVTTHMVNTWHPGSGGLKEGTRVTVDGPPTGGSQDLGFHNPPVNVSTSFLDFPVSWVLAAGETYDLQFVRVIAGDVVQGDYRVGATETEATIPALPSTSDPSQMFQGSKHVFVGNCTEPRHGDVCGKLSFAGKSIL